VNTTVQALFSTSTQEAINSAVAASKEGKDAVSFLEPQAIGWQFQEAVAYVRTFSEWVRASKGRFRRFIAITGLSPVLNNDTRWNSW